MALAAGLRTVGVKPRILFSGCNNYLPTRVSVAFITGKASRVEEEEKPTPWPYKERGYRNWHAMIDGTRKRIGENSKVIVVEGPQAIGKSALARSLAEELEMKYFPMVTADHWYINRYGYDLRMMDKDLPEYLKSYDEKDFIKNPRSEKVIRLQYFLFSRRIKQYMDALAHLLNTGEGVVLDRCIFSDMVFNDTFLEMGYITKTERAAIQKMKDKVMHNLLKPHLIVYLDAPVSVVEENLRKRGQGEEKVWNREMLEKFENIYKHTYLKSITKHAELLAYDWSTPGDPEVIVEDIERIDFERFDIHDPKMEDWRLKEDQDWCEKRWEFTTRTVTIMNAIVNTPTTDVSILDIQGEDQEHYEELLEKVPGMKYQPGFNPDMGDKGIMFRVPRIFVEDWKDFDPKLKA